MTAPIIIAEWAINSRDRVRVSIEQFNGIWLVNVRKWFEADDGAMRPVKAGIALGVRHLPQLAEALTQALAVAERQLILVPPTPPLATSGKGQP